MTIGERVKKLRDERGMLQGALADKVNVSQQTISRIELDETPMTSDVLANMAKFFRVSADYILGLSKVRVCVDQQERHIERLDGLYELIRPYDELTVKNKKIACKMVECLLEAQIEETS